MVAKKEVKNQLEKKNFYLAILSKINSSTNLTDIRKELSLKKQNLNYYLSILCKKGFLINTSNGSYELTEKGKNPTKYDSFLDKDSVRGHAYVWTVKLVKKPANWSKRLELIKSKDIHYKLVGAKENTPRIKALNRKVWLCNDHLRIFDIKDASYYGRTAAESRKNAFIQLLKIVNALENKLGFMFKPFIWEFRKEHYALIKNDLAIEHNKQGEILRIKDESGEWLLIDDSLEKGGELETIGKKAFETNIPMQKWWNNQKETNFKVTPEFILNNFNKISQIQSIETSKWGEYAKHIESHTKAIKELSKGIKQITRLIYKTSEQNKKYKLGTQTLLSDY